MRAAIYARVSTIGHGQSPEIQLCEVRQYCQRRGWQVAGEPEQDGDDWTVVFRMDGLERDAYDEHSVQGVLLHRTTQSVVGRVPERRPRSCPPPSISGVIRARGRRRT